MRRDAIFYQLFKRFPILFFDLIQIPPEQAAGYRFESVEIKEPTFRIDGVFLPTERASSKTIFFAEVQFQKDSLLYHRFFSELFLYLYRNPDEFTDWCGVLIFPNRRVEPDDGTLHRALLSSNQVRRVYLDELDVEQSIGIHLLKLVIEPEETTVEQARQLISQARSGDTENLVSSEIIDMVVTITAYKLINLSRSEVEAMLDATFKETRVYRDIREEVLAEGRAEGRAEGKIEGKLELVPMLLELGLTVEQIAERLNLDIVHIQQVADSQSPG
ncbi:MAG TPA: Rpn family recombination-promoting nuclease/putative transposase [Elainellaceae cyanobacterium]